MIEVMMMLMPSRFTSIQVLGASFLALKVRVTCLEAKVQVTYLKAMARVTGH